MTDLENAIKDEKSTDKWLMGCTMCDEGLCDFIDSLITEQKMKKNKAIKVATEMANEKIGADFFNVNTIKSKYYRGKGMIDDTPKKKKVEISPKKDTNVEESKPKDTDVKESEALDSPTETDPNELAQALVSSLQAVIGGLRAFNDLETITQQDGVRQDLAFVLVEVIPEAKRALNRINKGE